MNFISLLNGLVSVFIMSPQQCWSLGYSEVALEYGKKMSTKIEGGTVSY